MAPRGRWAASVVIVASLAIGALPARSHPIPQARRCRPFPATSHWNQPVNKLPLVSNSAAMIRSIGADDGLVADFGSGTRNEAPIGMPVVVVPRDQEEVPVRIDPYADESDRGPYPIPPGAPTESGAHQTGDRHLIIVQRGSCKLHELDEAHEMDGGRLWRAESAARWDMDSNRLRPRGWRSADGAGLPIFPGLVRWHEIVHGSIDHALRLTVPMTRAAYIYPARNALTEETNPDVPAMGERVRLKSSFDLSGFPREVRLILAALKRHGAFVADHGPVWSLSGSPDENWDDAALARLGEVKGRDLEIVDTSRLPRP